MNLVTYAASHNDDEDTQPAVNLAAELDNLTLKEARALLSLTALAAAMPGVESAANNRPDRVLHFWREAFNLLR